MPTYAIGDVQGCHQPLLRLLDSLRFDPASDRLWFAGDLVNRGPESLQVLRFVCGLGERAVTVLGNHDLHLLAVSEGVRKALRKDSLGAILEAPDRDDLLGWLRRQPLAYRDDAFAHVMVHAGIPPQWSIEDTLARSREVEHALQGPLYRDFLHHMYGNFPDTWDDRLEGFERLRLITNYLTRMRFCAADGKLDLDNKSPPARRQPRLRALVLPRGKAQRRCPGRVRPLGLAGRPGGARRRARPRHRLRMGRPAARHAARGRRAVPLRLLNIPCCGSPFMATTAFGRHLSA